MQPQNPLQLVGRRLHLRDMTLHDLDPFAYWLHPDHEWHHYDGPYYPSTPAEDIPNVIERTRKRIEKADWSSPRDRLIIADKHTNALMGMVTRYWISAETNWTAIGIVIYDPAYWGKGYGYEALGLWSDYLFAQEPKFVRLDLRTWSGNNGMMRLAEKLGYQQEACFRMARIVDGQYYDGLGYGVLRSEWLARYPQGFAASLVDSE